MLSLTAFTVDDDTPGFDAVTSVAGVSGTVYATTSSLYVAASHWGAWWDGTDSAVTTNVYKFDVSNPALPLTAMGAPRLLALTGRRRRVTLQLDAAGARVKKQLQSEHANLH